MEQARTFKCSVALVIILAAACVAQKYPLTLMHGGKSYEGLVEVNVAKGEEIYKTAYTVADDGSEPRTGPDAPYSVRDVNQKLDALVDEANAVCYLSSYDANTEVSPVALKETLESSESEVHNVDENKDVAEILRTTGRPIEDVTAVSVVIGPHCADKTSYFTVPAEEKNEQAQRDTKSRSAGCSYIEVTEYTWVKKCSWLLFCKRVPETHTKTVLKCS